MPNFAGINQIGSVCVHTYRRDSDRSMAGRMARRSNQNSIPSNPSIRSKSDGAGPGVRSTVMYGEQICARARTRGCILIRASPAWAGRGLEFLSLFESLCSSCLFELFLLVELSHVETTLAAQKACAE